MNLTSLFYDAVGRSFLIYLGIYFLINCFLLYRIFLVRKYNSYLKKILLAFVFLFGVGLQELLLYLCGNFNGYLPDNHQVLLIKLFVFTSLFVVVLFQSIGFLEGSTTLCIKYLGCLYVVIAGTDTIHHFFNISLRYYTLLLSGLLVLVVLLLLVKFASMCLKRYDVIVKTIRKGNLVVVFSIMNIGLFASYMVFMAVVSEGGIVYITAFALLLLIHLLLIYGGCRGIYTRRMYQSGSDDSSQLKCLMEERIPDDYKIIQRLMQYFESEKPYLDNELKLEEVSRHIYTNKTYLSRALNQRMSKNFNQFVNAYRVKEACRIYIENPLIKIGELCDKSGFRNISSFNNSFNLNIGYTPAEWCKEVRRKLNNKEHVSVQDYFI